jgi:hypothetical protein
VFGFSRKLSFSAPKKCRNFQVCYSQVHPKKRGNRGKIISLTSNALLNVRLQDFWVQVEVNKNIAMVLIFNFRQFQSCADSLWKLFKVSVKIPRDCLMKKNQIKAIRFPYSRSTEKTKDVNLDTFLRKPKRSAVSVSLHSAFHYWEKNDAKHSLTNIFESRSCKSFTRPSQSATRNYLEDYVSALVESVGCGCMQYPKVLQKIRSLSIRHSM